MSYRPEWELWLIETLRAVCSGLWEVGWMSEGVVSVESFGASSSTATSFFPLSLLPHPTQAHHIHTASSKWHWLFCSRCLATILKLLPQAPCRRARG